MADEQYGGLLRRLRAGRRLSGYAVARAAGLHPNLLARSEAGTRPPDGPAEVLALARALGLGQEERDELLTAAGYWPSEFLALGHSDTTLRSVAAALGRLGNDPARLERLRAAIGALLELVSTDGA